MGLRPRRLPADVVDRAKFLAQLFPDWSAAQIHRKITEEFSGQSSSLRSIRDIVNEARTRDSSEPWTIRDGDPKNSPVILGVLAAVMRESEGGRRHLTRQEASWVVAVHDASPDLSPWQLFLFARAYMERATDGKPVDDLDGLLAFAFWRDNATAYNEAISGGWVRHLPLFWIPMLFPDTPIRLEAPPGTTWGRSDVKKPKGSAGTSNRVRKGNKNG